VNPSGALTFDIETHSASLLYSMPPEEFVRLIGYAWGDGEVVLTTSLDEIRQQILRAAWVIGHNVHTFDLRAVFGIESNIPMQLADEGRVYDTWTHAALVHTPPPKYINRKGQPARVTKPEEAKAWYALDEQAYQLGVPGKTHDLRELAAEFGDPSLQGKARSTDGFGKIPVDDPRYREYLVGDVRASRAVAKALLKRGPLDDYAMREQRIESRKATVQSNGVRLSIERATARRDELAIKRDEIMRYLVRQYQFPTNGKSPWATREGKSAILDALAAEAGITPSTVEWPRTEAWDKREEKAAEAREKREKLQAQVDGWRAELASGKLTQFKTKVRRGWIEKAEKALGEPLLPRDFGLSFAGDTMIDLTDGTPAAEMGRALAELMGQRSLAQLALDSVHPDGKVHPEITMLQKSGRWSTTEPGLTVWTSRGDNKVEKAYFLADSDDEVLLEIDLSNADARAVAAYSGDVRYAERFKPGADGHLINAWAAWGKDVVGTDKHDETTAGYRFKAKALGHGWNYGGQAKTLSTQAGLPLEVAEAFCAGMAKAFPKLMAWQDSVRKYARIHGCVVNPWGRRMPVDKGREFTQAPALLGQSATREVVCDALLSLPHHVMRTVRMQIHDALIFSVPRRNWEECRDYLLQHIESHMDPKGGQRIEFPAGCGPAADNWMDCSHD
jgi:DNA polymerase-1